MTGKTQWEDPTPKPIQDGARAVVCWSARQRQHCRQCAQPLNKSLSKGFFDVKLVMEARSLAAIACTVFGNARDSDINLLAANGNEYWVDPETGESTWYMPEEFGWAPVDDKEVGRLFYHNSVTKVRSVFVFGAPRHQPGLQPISDSS